MKVSETNPLVEHNAVFELNAINGLPDCSGCYCLTNARGDILFAGQAVSLQRRIVAHFNTRKETITIYGRISRVWWCSAPTVSLGALERSWLEAIQLRDGCLPPLNRVSRPVLALDSQTGPGSKASRRWSAR